MPLWGNTDDAANSVLSATALVNKPLGYAGSTNRENLTDLYGNTTVDAFIDDISIGLFAVDADEIGVQANASIAEYIVTFGGSGYAANAAVTVIQGDGESNTTAANAESSAGRIISVQGYTGSGYTTGSPPAVTIAAPSAINIVANTVGYTGSATAGGFSNTADTLAIATANSKFIAGYIGSATFDGDRVLYDIPAENTPISPLTANTYYYVVFANTTTIKISATPRGTPIDIDDDRVTNPGEVHTLTGDTATAVAVTTGIASGAAHQGWVIRRVGTGGRAGRVQHETLVAMNMSNDDDGSDDTVMKDS